MSREIVLDVETTGLDAAGGDRIVEVGCVELVNHVPTGTTFHRYINPERSMPAEAERVHGLSNAFLAGQPVFAAVSDELAEFLGDARLIAHNAGFDIGFINAEFDRLGLPAITFDRVVDTLMLARRRHANSPNSLDALCQRYGIDISHRTLHGGLLDAHLLTEVYIELIGGRQANLALVSEIETVAAGVVTTAPAARRPVERPVSVSDEELAAHAALIATLGDAPVWQAYLTAAA